MKYTLITGASRGIGRAVALRLAKMGQPIIINYRSNEAKALEVKKLVEAEGRQAEPHAFRRYRRRSCQQSYGRLGERASR